MTFSSPSNLSISSSEISLGLWHNFGDVNTFANSLSMAHYAFDKGITHFDLANTFRNESRRTAGFISFIFYYW